MQEKVILRWLKWILTIFFLWLDGASLIVLFQGERWFILGVLVAVAALALGAILSYEFFRGETIG